MTGDTIAILPSGEPFDCETKLKKVSLASVRSPRVGNEKIGKADEPYANECKERLRALCAGKNVKVSIHYERDIPMGDVRWLIHTFLCKKCASNDLFSNVSSHSFNLNQSTENRQFGTISVGKRPDVGETLVLEGLAVTQHHRDDEEKSPRYDLLVAAENASKDAQKGVHSPKEYKPNTTNDLTDPKKAKAYSGSLFRAGTLKAIVEYVFNGSRFKLFVPAENCHIMFALENLKSPQPSAPQVIVSRGQGKFVHSFHFYQPTHTHN